MTKETKPREIKDLDGDLPRKEWVYPVNPPRTVSDNFDDHRARKSADPGTDYVKGRGSRVFSIHAGRVVYVQTQPDGPSGRYIVINHGHGLVTRYLHLDSVTVREGIRVLAGTVIGRVGGSGFGKENGYGVHLHFSVTRDGVYRDPEVFLRRRLSR